MYLDDGDEVEVDGCGGYGVEWRAGCCYTWMMVIWHECDSGLNPTLREAGKSLSPVFSLRTGMSMCCCSSSSGGEEKHRH
jgi:hypothetical protein